MKIHRSTGFVAAAVAMSLALAGCAGDDGGSSSSAGTSKDTTSSQAGSPTAIITTNGSEPQNPLIPTNTTEVGGGKIVDMLFAKLVAYDAHGKPYNEVAESIESPDATVWTVKLKDGWTFTNGEKVTADSFINAWNYGAKKSNAQGSAYFFEDIEGFSYDEDTELTGLKKVGDLEFTVTLSHPASDFPTRLGYSAFAPLPSTAFEDIAAFGENPVGNGPYKLEAWEHNVQAKLVTNPDYAGEKKPQNGGVTVIFYTDPAAAYNDLLANNLDVLDVIPDSAVATFETDLGDRATNQAAAIFQSLEIPTYVKHFGIDEEGRLRRQAISYAINRDEITQVIFNGTRTPAKDFTSPVIDGWSDSVPGNEVLTYDAAKAKELWAQADAISKYEGTFYLAYNADGAHQGWIDAVANSIKNTLGINAEGKPYPTFADALEDRKNDKIDGSTRAGWQGDYPGLYNFLAPLYRTGGGSNYGRYSSEQFDTLLDEAAAANDTATSNAKLQEAQQVLFTDLPVIPLWYQNAIGGFSEKVSNVEVGWNSVPLYYQITKSE